MQTSNPRDREAQTPPEPIAPVTPTPLSIRSTSSLSEDFLERKDLYLAPGSSTLALYKNPFTMDLIEGAVAIDGAYYTLRRDQTGGTWQLEKYADPEKAAVGVTEVASFVDPNGGIGTVASTPDWLSVFDVTADGPKYSYALPTAKGLTNVKVNYTPPLPQRRPYIYGATPDGNLMVLDFITTRGGLEPYAFDVKGVLADKDFVMASADGYRVLMTVVNGILTWYVLSRNTIFGPYAASQIAIKQVVMLYVSSDSGTPSLDAIVLGPEDQTTRDSQIYFVNKLGGAELYNPQLHPIGNVRAARAVGVLDAQSLMHLYLVDSKNNVSVLHQTGWKGQPLVPEFAAATLDSNVVPVAIPFASGIVDVAVDPYPNDHPVLAAYSAEGGSDQKQKPLRFIGQDRDTLAWWNEAVQLADTHLYQVSRWQTRVTLLDREGQPVPLYYLSLHADTTTTVHVGRESYVLDPRRRTQVEVPTDLRGQLVFSLPALGLTAPAITVSAEGLPASAEIRPDATVQSYLAGTGRLPFKEPFDGPTLQNAMLDGRPLVPPSVWTKTRTPANAVEGMRSIIALADPNLPTPKIAGFVLQAYAPDRPFFQPLATIAELEAARAELRALPEFGGWWDDVGDFASDVWEGVKNGAAVVAGAVVNVAEKAVDLAIMIGGKVFALAQLAIETLTDAFNAVTAFFNMLLVKAKDAIDWLRRALAFEDIWNTHKAIDQALHRMTPLLTGYVDRVRNLVDDSFFAQLPAKIDAAFTSLGGRFDNIVIGELNTKHGEPSFLTRTGQALLYASEIADTIIDPVAMWVWDRLLGSWAEPLAKALPSIVLPSLQPLQEPAQRFVTALEGVLGEFESVFGDLYQWMTTATSRQDVDRGESFESALFNELLSVLRRISLAGVNLLRAIFDALFDLLKAVAELFEKFFDSEINLGIISTAWQWFQEQAGVSAAAQSPLTVGGLFSLAVAAPATILYKLIYGVDAQPFPNGVLPSGAAVAAASDNQAGDACVLAGMAAAILNAFVQVGCDGYAVATTIVPPGEEKVPILQDIEILLGVASVALAGATSALSWPSKSAVPGSEPDFNTPGGIATFVNWLVGWCQPALDFVFLGISGSIDTERPKAGRIMQFVDPIGVVLDASLGVATLVTGLVESGLAGESELQWVANVFQPLSSITLPLRSKLVLRALLPWVEWVGGIKIAFDGISLLGSTFKWAWMPSKQAPALIGLAAADP